VVANFTPGVHHDYRVRVPFAGKWREVLNTDSVHYGGSDTGNGGLVETLDGVIPELSLTLPPLAVIFLIPEPA
jgi:1,4-alpha-glucan branching enzyme